MSSEFWDHIKQFIVNMEVSRLAQVIEEAPTLDKILDMSQMKHYFQKIFDYYQVMQTKIM